MRQLRPPFLLSISLIMLMAGMGSGATNTPGKSRSVAIMPLYNVSSSKDLAYLSTTIPASLATSLKNMGRFEVILQEKVSKIIPADTAEIDYQKAMKSGQALKADIVIIGSYAVMKDTIDINLEAIDVHSGRTKVAEGTWGLTGVELFDVIDTLCKNMVKKMAQELPPLANYEIKKEEVKFEDVYAGEFQQNSVLIAGLGMSGIFDTSPTSDLHPQATPFGSVATILFEYGYKRFSAGVSGQPPLVSLGGAGGSSYAGGGMKANIKFEILKDKLTAFAQWNVFLNQSYSSSSNQNTFNTSSSPVTVGAGWRFSPAFYVELGLGMDTTPVQYFYLPSGGSTTITSKFPVIHGEVEWMFSRNYGLLVDVLYGGFHVEQPDMSISYLQIHPIFIYKARF